MAISDAESLLLAALQVTDRWVTRTDNAARRAFNRYQAGTCNVTAEKWARLEIRALNARREHWAVQARIARLRATEVR